MERTVVVGVDGSAGSRAAGDWAAREAVCRGLALQVVHVEPGPGPQPAAWPAPGRPCDVAVRAAGELAARYPELAIGGVTVEGEPVSALSGRDQNTDLVVLGMRGTEGTEGTEGPGAGTVALSVAASSHRPVVLVPPEFAYEVPGRRMDRIAVGVDARRPDEAAVDFAFDTACRRAARLRLVHAWKLPLPEAAWMPYAVPEEDRGRWEDHEEQVLADALRPWRAKYPSVRVLADVVLLGVADALVKASARAETLVVGRRHEGALPPAVRALLQHTRCPVAVVPV
ncbi:universal stress protein [Streptomyces sp. ME02-8801-2C]|uniref:universal stress protein n=1 Tax=Streptomyces sp. ME02-8801-2C TaxID=3028680 RepID=UPI0029A36B81|nr:universal stress protein [Streptomyces sp. ME02-8801-2C]MDX3458897.1 universal stress protein [Streptomyces sp. ME02-8801-2C]